MSLLRGLQESCLLSWGATVPAFVRVEGLLRHHSALLEQDLLLGVMGLWGPFWRLQCEGAQAGQAALRAEEGGELSGRVDGALERGAGPVSKG